MEKAKSNNITEKQMLAEIKTLASRIYIMHDKGYFDTRIKNLIETWVASLENRKIIKIIKEK